MIFFSVLSGAGYGLIACAAIAALLGPACIATVCTQAVLPVDAQAPFLASVALFGIAWVCAGLGASVLHLGRPERAWRAFSQWRSSWLSREGISASASLLAAGGFVALLWTGSLVSPWISLAASASLLFAITTLLCTARIYTSLPPIPAWRSALVLPGFFLFAATMGLALWLMASRLLIGSAPDSAGLALGLLALATAAIKWRYWREIDAIAMPGTAHMTGLDRIGEARTFEAPHTEANYLTREMGFRFARRHARVLRGTVLCALVAVAGTALLQSIVPGLSAPVPKPWLLTTHGTTIVTTVSTALFVATALLAAGAALVERWLFFAEARHMVAAYYQP